MSFKSIKVRVKKQIVSGILIRSVDSLLKLVFTISLFDNLKGVVQCQFLISEVSKNGSDKKTELFLSYHSHVRGPLH